MTFCPKALETAGQQPRDNTRTLLSPSLSLCFLSPSSRSTTLAAPDRQPWLLGSPRVGGDVLHRGAWLGNHGAQAEPRSPWCCCVVVCRDSGSDTIFPQPDSEFIFLTSPCSLFFFF
ncbi:hypothetical protein BDA96_06G040000 [Sorghum bicolor]|uniref:Uncharacterized protein n=1 Tax=Sorghum bicolor TaxID=4558 RepID=A0A921UC05_SORBI|nr:hypothetical protein BDA96_06G040000 [Sorghum bicolor]